jgi:formate hydrogenlyase subunit 6/NADH:ubiquinone oxidoreductase subunit I
MPLGFPPTKSGVEINLLRTIFTPQEASLATHLDYKHKTVEQILETAQADVESREELTHHLDAMVAKGGIARRERDGQKQYAVVPLVLWGMYEQQLKRLSPEFLSNYGQYMQGEFALELATGTLPMMRVIPVEESIEVDQAVSTYDELRALIEQAGERITIQECMCRKIKDLQGDNCEATDRREVCMSMGDLADLYAEEGWGRRITREEALEIARRNEEEGLVLMPGNVVDTQFMCSCCSDCCAMLSMMKYVPKPAEMLAHNFYAQVDAARCTGCGVCVDRCPTVAIKSVDTAYTVDLTRCIGCGVCVPVCPEDALLLVKKEAETVPPQTEEDRYDAMLAYKNSFTGKVKGALTKTLIRVASRFSKPAAQ